MYKKNILSPHEKKNCYNPLNEIKYVYLIDKEGKYLFSLVNNLTASLKGCNNPIIPYALECTLKLYAPVDYKMPPRFKYLN